ncbi:unnamed protein product [Protopolystoma xenopodis]|uniref:Uncharacterized protein n=1 Tax=Protopolystoma xenopodis TaxID=117903 RepID=A0A448WU70_9PLAT|nr:unnamed protein product [Protopolystoma xenopodis]
MIQLGGVFGIQFPPKLSFTGQLGPETSSFGVSTHILGKQIGQMSSRHLSDTGEQSNVLCDELAGKEDKPPTCRQNWDFTPSHPVTWRTYASERGTGCRFSESVCPSDRIKSVAMGIAERDRSTQTIRFEASFQRE